MRNKALVVGSVAYDVVFSVHNNFKEEVIVEEGKVKDLSMMLTAENKQVFFGGTAGNIAYGLGIQGTSPLMFSVVGDDLNNDYRAHLESNGVNIKAKVFQGEHTASFYAISDVEKDQIGIFQPNTHGDYMGSTNLSEMLINEDFEKIKIAIFSPGTGESIRNHMEELREKSGVESLVIFDPSQVLSIFFDEKLTMECIELSDIFIGNETEIDQLKKLLNTDLKNILNFGLKYIIETKGKDGAITHTHDGEKFIPSTSPKTFAEQTGAGDAFRAGLIKGLLSDMKIEDACKVGSLMGAKNVEALGGQNYKL
ncbi:MAG: PfkB family carbohydrate kinase [Candidatus Dojkabacteria bacterium]|nr:PfkB family carbohydrate kinase [Candidatus Dojkabacteria bacterium]MDQ7021558.1 PfkB family carbohydrate kinase [Candidatus Dojkabacteria bacterium]